tara:strand:- start:27461 stop:27607 length:147 start_codon:yes stop_codon:yes gene_type:complete
MTDEKHHTTAEDRRKELKVLLDKIAAHPERDTTAERERVAVLKKVLAD